MLKYLTGEAVLAGDLIRTYDGAEARVFLVIEPDTEDAIDYQCPAGGFLYRVGMTPGEGFWLQNGEAESKHWDIEFVSRGDVPKNW